MNAMTVTAFPKAADDRARQSLRLAPNLWAAIDAARAGRVGMVSRNTWIAEAIVEKITREQTEQAISNTGDRRRV
jgi:ABC-type Fe3+-citrate transport system substrate-binding protein